MHKSYLYGINGKEPNAVCLQYCNIANIAILAILDLFPHGMQGSVTSMAVWSCAADTPCFCVET